MKNVLQLFNIQAHSTLIYRIKKNKELIINFNPNNY